MIRDWRAKFKLALPFLWVQISPWEGHEAATSSYQLPEMRCVPTIGSNFSHFSVLCVVYCEL
jgi:hypothetical protein